MKLLENYKRENMFKYFSSLDNPFAITTFEIDITKVVNYAKEHKHFNAIMGFIIKKAVLENEAFRLRYIDNKFYLCENVGISFTQLKDDNVDFINCDSDDMEDFFKEYDQKKLELLDNIKTSFDDERRIEEDRQDVIWLSCLPWHSFTGLVPPFDKKVTIPQVIWDKYEEVNGKYYCHLMVLVHHGFADGLHISRFVDSIENNINILD